MYDYVIKYLNLLSGRSNHFQSYHNYCTINLLNSRQSAENLHQAASLFIENTRYNCHKIGIIRFNSIATIVQDIMPVDTRQDKDTLLNLVPRESDGGTCIGCGIILGIQVSHAIICSY